MNANELLKTCLTQIVNNIDCGNSNLEEDECLELTFDRWIKDKKIPKGQKEQGFKELFWTLEDLKNVKNKNNYSY